MYFLMIFSQSILFHIIVLIILCFSFLFFITATNIITAYTRDFLFDDSKGIDEGFTSWHPLQHLYEFSIPLFLFFGVILKKPQTPLIISSHKNKIKNFFLQSFSILLPALICLTLASLCLFTAYLVWGKIFIPLAINISVSSNASIIQMLKEVFPFARGFSIIAILFLIYGININLILGMLELFIGLIYFIWETYFDSLAQNPTSWIIINVMLIIGFVFARNILFFMCWKIILAPLMIIA